MGLVISLFNILCLLIINLDFLANGDGIGLNYGLLGDNLPSAANVISLVKSRNVAHIRIFTPNHDILDALKSSGIDVIVGTLNDDIPNFANDINFAITWVQTNIVPYAPSVTFRCISVGNEVLNEVLSGDLTPLVFPAMNNLHTALQSFSLGNIPVSKTAGAYMLASSYPPSNGSFSESVKPALQQITGFLACNNFPLLATVYPYFAYASNSVDIPLSYALLNSTEIVVTDGSLEYTNLLDAMVDAFYLALEKIGAGSVDVVLCESGWPSKGNGDYTTINLAQTYNQNLVRHALNSGTPKKPEKKLETYIFVIFNENKKSPETEQNFGLYYPDMTEVYHIDFNNVTMVYD